MDVKTFIKDSLKKLKDLGIDAMDMEETLTNSILRMPSDMLADMEKEQIIGLLLNDIGTGSYDEENGTCIGMSEQIYSFDMEVFDIGEMYTIFLKGVSRIVKEDFTFTDIEEDTSKVDFESGTGIQTIRFRCNGKECQYDARVEYDWFDPNMMVYMNQIIKEQNTGKCLYVTSDGY